MGLLDKLFRKKQKIEFPPKPKWKPDLPVDIDLVYEKTKYYTGSKLQFAIFKNGTVAYFPTAVNNIEEAAKESLNKIYNFHPDFNPVTMDDGNYLIEYNHPAFNIVFEHELRQHWNYIETHHMDGVCAHEVLINPQGQANVFDRIGKICLFGRAKMFMDAQAPVIVKTFSFRSV